MDGMNTSGKRTLIVVAAVAVALLACFVWLVSRPDERPAASIPNTSGGPSFEVRVEKPRVNRFLFGILPTRLEDKMFGNGELRFDHTSRGAESVNVGHDRLELRADGWNLFIEIDGAGKVTPGTRLVFPILLAERQRTLRCRPEDPATGYLHTATRAGGGSDALGGSFLVELSTCENAETGKVIDWPQSPLTVSGSFEGLPRVSR
jgi:hypothetical protein